MSTKIELVKKYFSLLASFVAPEKFRDLVHPEIEQAEFPNLLNRQGQKSDLQDISRRMLVVETIWRGKTAVDGGPLKAFFCIVLELRDGKIYRQRNYDCFEPFN
jgi:hypothetical protein